MPTVYCLRIASEHNLPVWLFNLLIPEYSLYKIKLFYLLWHVEEPRNVGNSEETGGSKWEIVVEQRRLLELMIHLWQL